MKDSDDIAIYPLSEARTCALKDDPTRVVLMLRSGKDVRHYVMHLDDFAGLAKQLSNDARLLTG